MGRIHTKHFTRDHNDHYSFHNQLQPIKLSLWLGNGIGWILYWHCCKFSYQLVFMNSLIFYCLPYCRQSTKVFSTNTYAYNVTYGGHNSEIKHVELCCLFQFHFQKEASSKSMLISIKRINNVRGKLFQLIKSLYSWFYWIPNTQFPSQIMTNKTIRIPMTSIL